MSPTMKCRGAPGDALGHMPQWRFPAWKLDPASTTPPEPRTALNPTSLIAVNCPWASTDRLAFVSGRKSVLPEPIKLLTPPTPTLGIAIAPLVAAPSGV